MERTGERRAKTQNVCGSSMSAVMFVLAALHAMCVWEGEMLPQSVSAFPKPLR